MMAKKKKVAAKKNLAAANGYDAVESSGKRRAASSVLKHEDEVLDARKRRVMTGGMSGLYRNFSMVSWAVRKHLDYNSAYRFQVHTEDQAFNEELESLMGQWSRPATCDASGRMTLAQIIRTSESRRVLDGDCFWVKLNRGSLSVAEGDRIQNPPKNETGEDWYNGVQVNRDGRPIRYGLYNRTRRSGYEFARTLRAENVIPIIGYDRFDQQRGISPLACAYNSFADLYEGVDYALAKMKVEQLFALVIQSTSGSGTGEYSRNGDGTYDVDFGRGPVKLELDNDDEAKFLTSDNPGSNTQDFIQLVLSMAIKALDLPQNFADESRTNFFGSRAAWMLYDRSCESKRSIMLEALRKMTIWKFQDWIRRGELTLPAGMTVNDIAFEWVHVGMPWWDPSKEIEADVMAISAGLDNPFRIVKERGRGSFEDNLKQIARANELAESLGVELSFNVSAAPEEDMTSEEWDTEEEESDEDEVEE